MNRIKFMAGLMAGATLATVPIPSLVAPQQTGMVRGMSWPAKDIFPLDAIVDFIRSSKNSPIKGFPETYNFRIEIPKSYSPFTMEWFGADIPVIQVDHLTNRMSIMEEIHGT